MNTLISGTTYFIHDVASLESKFTLSQESKLDAVWCISLYVSSDGHVQVECAG